MPIPKFDETMLPILKVLQSKKPKQKKEVDKDFF